MPTNHNTTPFNHHEVDDTPEQAVSESTRRAAGKRVLFRVMNLDNHGGIQHRAEDGTVTYVVENQQYPDQGDFAFGHEETGFQEATTRAFPRNLHNVHAVEVDADHIVEPYPEDAPGLVYIKNGATATARRVPGRIIESYIESPDSTPDLSRRVADELFPDKTTDG